MTEADQPPSSVDAPEPSDDTEPPARPAGPRPRRLRWWAVPIAVVLALLVAEGFARVVGPDLPKLAGTDEETLVKASDIEDRAGTRTDVVALGASETAAGIDPSALDEATTRLSGAYNAAMRGASPKTNEAWAERVVGPELNPRVAVVGVLPWGLAVLDGDGAAFQDRSDDAYAAAIGEADPDLLGRIGQRVEDRSALFRYRHQLRQPSSVLEGVQAWASGEPAEVAPNLDPAVIRRNIGESGQSLEYAERPEGQGPDPALGAELNRVSQGEFELGELEDLLRSLRAQGIEPVVALAPTDRTTLKASGVDFAAIDGVADDVVALSEELDVPVLDSFRADYGTDLFHDKQHLNAAGADRWSREIGVWLDQLCTAELATACG